MQRTRIQRPTARPRRPGFTLIELMVSVALICMVLTVLAQAFSVGLDSFGKLKALGDMADRLRYAAGLMRRDLAAYHFEGSRRLSDANFGNNAPKAGFFYINQYPDTTGTTGSMNEGNSDGIASLRSPRSLPASPTSTPTGPFGSKALYFTVRRNGNTEQDFFSAPVPGNSPLLTFPDCTGYFGACSQYANGVSASNATVWNSPANLSPDSRRQESTNLAFNSQWAEVIYFLQPQLGVQARDTPLYTLHRVARPMVMDARGASVPGAAITDYGYVASWLNGSTVQFVSPTDVATPGNRSLMAGPNPLSKDPTDPASMLTAALITTGEPQILMLVRTMLLTDVISFDVQIVPSALVPLPDTINPPPKFGSPLNGNGAPISTSYDSGLTGVPPAGWSNGGVMLVQITLRVWDLRSSQTRQITIIQDM